MGNVKNKMSEIDEKEREMKKETSAPILYFSYKKIEERVLIALLRCKTCREDFTLGDLLDQLGEKELMALQERINESKEPRIINP
jgi:hypothetical protein